MKLIDGKLISQQIKEEIAIEVEKMVKSGAKRPHLAAILVGNDGGSLTYVGHKVKACEQVGFKSTLLHYEDSDSVTEEFLLSKIKELNENNDVDGFIVQLPLPGHIDENKVIEAIDYRKDVDGFHPVNVGRMIQGLPAFISATPAGIMELIKRYNIEISGKKCVILGRSNIVGRPLSILMSMKSEPGNATVTLCHSRTPNIADFTKKADIIIAAMGKPGFLKADMVKEGAVVIDVGTTRLKSDKTKSGWKLFGDVDFENVSPKCSYITPVPGGVGPMTIVSLLKNTLLAAKKEIYND
ncbi:MAG: bifunctional methylenetetrahydrofolate dehydrogenase/methenyltetrahydrofolate cyclohydrolase FolD [Marinilabiliales bacterium]